MRVEVGLKGKSIVSSEVETVTIIVKGVKYILNEGTFGGVILVKHDLEADDVIAIRPINPNSIAIK